MRFGKLRKECEGMKCANRGHRDRGSRLQNRHRHRHLGVVGCRHLGQSNRDRRRRRRDRDLLLAISQGHKPRQSQSHTSQWSTKWLSAKATLRGKDKATRHRSAKCSRSFPHFGIASRCRQQHGSEAVPSRVHEKTPGQRWHDGRVSKFEAGIRDVVVDSGSQSKGTTSMPTRDAACKHRSSAHSQGR